MTETLRLVATVGGVVLIVGMLSDAVATLIVTQGSSSLWRPTRLFYAATWRGARALAARLHDRSGEYVLNVYPALSLLGLLVIWLAGLMIGWSLVYWGLDQHIGGTRDWGTLVYYAGTSLVTPVFGSAHGALIRMLTLLETLTGVVTIALMISYLPALYGAYSRRESRLLTLDDPLGERITPVRVDRAQCARRRRGDAVPGNGRMADVDRGPPREPRVVSHAGALPVPTPRPIVGHGARRGDRRRHVDRGLCGGGPEPRAVLPVPAGAPRHRGHLEPPPRAGARNAADVVGRGELRGGLARARSRSGCPCGTRPRPGRTCRSCARPTGTSSSA